MIEAKSELKQLVEEVKVYAELRTELLKVEAVEKGSGLAVGLVKYSILLFLGAIFLALLGIAGAFWLSAILGSYTLGFLAAAGIVLLLILIVLISAGWWKTGVRNSIIKSFFDEEDK